MSIPSTAIRCVIDMPLGCEVGEGHATAGIDVMTRNFAPGEELLRVDYGPDNNRAGAFLPALTEFSRLAPLVVRAGENVRIVHDFEDARIVLLAVPSHSDHFDLHEKLPVAGLDSRSMENGARISNDSGASLPGVMKFFSSQGETCICGRVTRGPLCSGCLDRLHIRLCRGIGQPRSVALLDAARAILFRFLLKLTGGASRSAGLFGGPVASTIRVLLRSFVAERQGARIWPTIVALKLVNFCTLEPTCPRH